MLRESITTVTVVIVSCGVEQMEVNIKKLVLDVLYHNSRRHGSTEMGIKALPEFLEFVLGHKFGLV